MRIYVVKRLPINLPPLSPVNTSILISLCTCAVSALVGQERQVTHAEHGHILTNVGSWSADSRWLAYDVRDVPEKFTGDRIERVDILTGDTEVVYRAPQNSNCGVVTWHPSDPILIFIQGPENPTDQWSYGFSRRRGVTVDLRHATDSPERVRPLDAMNYAPPFTAGALRGGSHVHVFSPDGEAVSFTYEDELLARPAPGIEDAEPNQRNIGVSFRSGGPVHVATNHPRNHDGDWFSVLATRTVAHPRPGSDEIRRAFEEGWVGKNGYLRADGTRQLKSLAFQGRVTAPDGQEHDEVFIVDLPEDISAPSPDGPITGTVTRCPLPPAGAVQRRLTFTSDRKYRGIQGPRHWLRSSPDGKNIAFLMRDDAGIVQMWLVSPLGGEPRQLTHIASGTGIASTFTWSPDGSSIAAVVNGQVCVIDAQDGAIKTLTPTPADEDNKPLDLACVFSPDGQYIAYQRRVGDYAQIFIIPVSSSSPEQSR